MPPTASLAAATAAAETPAALERQVEGERSLRPVHRAVAELRRGAAALLVASNPRSAWLVAAAELASPATLSRLAALGAAPPVLLLAPTRAAAVLQGPAPVGAGAPAVAFRLPPGVTPALLRSLADPTAEPPQTRPEPAPLVPVEAAAASIQLAKLARLLPAVVVAPVDTGGDASGLAQRHDLLAAPAEAVLSYPDMVAATLTRVAEASVPLEDSAATRIIAFRPADGGTEHLAIVVGDPWGAATPPLVRLHSECFTGDLLGSLRCDCGPQLRGALKRMAEEGSGVLLYLSQEGRGIGLVNKLRAYELQDRGADTHDANTRLGYGADERNFLIAAAMLRELGLGTVRILTNNPDKMAALEACGITVAGRVAHAFPATQHNARYLRTKAERFGHLF
ncbi:GTP cyclohydrolase II [Elioraea tepida]|jgi:GTP cyclohydrolase II|uniref:GTP cyclohydrolase-2 n=1 Tax=Elioraea tepida TaxID=2843330 RepID=A0A975U4A7_9PROT|nr:GTP cyclohydrolase II [Elioraea tepida]QXM26024.1 GTP cyclohydrolase II [Elioraea tepida]